MHSLNNVDDIIERVKYELRGLPNVRATRLNLRQTLNEVYLQLCESYRWPWLVQRRPLLALPDVTLDNNDIALVPTMSRWFVMGTSTFLSALGVPPAAGGPIASVYTQALFGAEFALADRARAVDGDGSWLLGPFEVWYMTGDDTVLYFVADPRLVVDSKTGDEGEFVFRFPRLSLAPDIDQVVAVYEKATGRQLQARSTSWAIGNGDEDAAGAPAVYWLDDAFRRSEQHRTYTATAMPPLPQFRNAEAYGRWLLEPPRGDAAATKFSPAGVTFTPTNGAGTLVAGTYRIFCTWTLAGRIGPRSEITEVVVASPHDTIEITNKPEVGEADIGKVLLWWISYNDGPFYLYQDTDNVDTFGIPMTQFPAFGGGTTYFTNNPDYRRDYAAVRWDDVMAGSPHRYLSVWPRPSTPLELELEVVVRPRDLMEGSDVPLLPRPFLDLLVWLTVERIASVQNADSGTMLRARALAKDRLDALRRRYGAHDGLRHIKGQVGDSADGGTWDWPNIDHRPD